MSDINIVENSIWPTTDGRLGINKVPIPDGVNTFWPEGNALVKNFIYKDDKLVGYIDTKSLIENETKTSVLPYEYVDITLDKRLEYSMTFEKGENCKYFNIKYESSLPLGYKRLDYLESTGTQYINTGVVLMNNSVVESRFQVLKGHKYGFIFGARYAVAVRAFCLYLDATNTWFNYGSQADRTSCPLLSKNVDYDFRAQANVWTVNNNAYILNPESAFDAGECYIFNMSVNGTVDTRFFIGRVYSFSISNGSEKHMFVPALDPTGAPCMYDLDARISFYNSGTGDFRYSIMDNQTSTYSLRNHMYAKMTEHGIRRLYRVPIDYSGTKEDYASENGFKQLVELPKPEEGNWIPNWRETDTELICEWIEEEIPSEI